MNIRSRNNGLGSEDSGKVVVVQRGKEETKKSGDLGKERQFKKKSILVRQRGVFVQMGFRDSLVKGDEFIIEGRKVRSPEGREHNKTYK